MNALKHAATSNLEVQQSQTALSKMLQGYQQNRSKTHDFSSQAPNYNFFPTVLYPTDAISSIFPAYAGTLETIGDLCQTRLIFILGGIHIVQMTFNPIKLPLPTSVIFSSSWRMERAPTSGLTFRRDVIHPASVVFELIPLTVTP
jgi:hypothetical protein